PSPQNVSRTCALQVCSSPTPAPTPTATPTPTPCRSPSAPAIQTATNLSFSSFTANWSGVSGAINYRLDVSTSSSFTTYLPGYQDLDLGNMIRFPVTGLYPQTTYYYRVRAYNGCNTSANSSSKSVTTTACTASAPSAQNASNVT